MVVLPDLFKKIYNMKKQIKVLNKIFDKPITCLTAYSASIAKLLDKI